METPRGSPLSSRTRSSSRLKRKPFSDLTNAPSSLLQRQSEPKRKPAAAPEPAPAVPESAFSSTAVADEQANDGELGISQCSPKSKCREVYDDSGQDVDDNTTSHTPMVFPFKMYASKKGKEKVVDAATTLGWPSLGRTRSTEESTSDIQASHVGSKSRLNREPFSELTNASSSLLRRRSRPKTKPTAVHEPIPADSRPTSSSTAASKQGNDRDPVRSAFTPKSRCKEVNKDSGKDVDDNNTLETPRVFSLIANATRKGQEKVFDAATTLSCPPLGRTRSTEECMRLEDHISNLHKGLSVPYVKTKKRKQDHGEPVKLQKPVLPPDFVEKQRAYFAEVDAFELPEEEAAESDLD